METGFIEGDASHIVGKASSEYDCAALIKRIRPDAKGMSYFSGQAGLGLCLAQYGSVLQSSNTDYKSCSFAGK